MLSRLLWTIGHAEREFIKDHFHALISHNLLWEATRVFSIHCGVAPNKDSFIAEQYDELMSTLGGIELLSTAEALPDGKNKLLCALAATEALIRYLNRSLSTDSKTYQNELVQIVRSSAAIEKLFQELHNPSPRGRRVSFWRTVDTQPNQELDFETEPAKDNTRPFHIETTGNNSMPKQIVVPRSLQTKMKQRLPQHSDPTGNSASFSLNEAQHELPAFSDSIISSEPDNEPNELLQIPSEFHRHTTRSGTAGTSASTSLRTKAISGGSFRGPRAVQMDQEPRNVVRNEFPAFEIDAGALGDWLDKRFPEAVPIVIEV